MYNPFINKKNTKEGDSNKKKRFQTFILFYFSKIEFIQFLYKRIFCIINNTEKGRWYKEKDIKY